MNETEFRFSTAGDNRVIVSGGLTVSALFEIPRENLRDGWREAAPNSLLDYPEAAIALATVRAAIDEYKLGDARVEYDYSIVDMKLRVVVSATLTPKVVSSTLQRLVASVTQRVAEQVARPKATKDTKDRPLTLRRKM